MPNYADFQGVVENETGKAVLLTGGSIALLFTALGEYLEKSENWVGSADFGELTTEEKDTIDEMIALAERELMTTYNSHSLTGIVFASPVDRVGALLCDGSQYLRVDYPDLYEALADTVYIVDADHFVTPDLVGRFVLGAETSGGTGGEATHTLSQAEMPAHRHKVDYAYSSTAGTVVNSGFASARVKAADFTTDIQGESEAHNNMPPYHEMRFYIWT